MEHAQDGRTLKPGNLQDVPATVRRRVEEIVEDFEEAASRSSPPAIEAMLPADPTLRPLVLVELVHVDLELRLKQGESVRVEEYLERFSGFADDQDAVVELISAEYDLRRRRDPTVATTEYLARFPQLRDELLRRLPAPHGNGGGPLAASRSPHRPSGRDTSPQDVAVTGLAHTDSTFREAAQGSGRSLEAKLPEHERFQLLAEVGRGSFATVYRAYDSQLDRIVAVKTPRHGSLADAADEKRFLREARSSAQLSHPGIVPVYEVGRGSWGPYIVSEYVEGETLAQTIDRRGLSFQQVARLMVDVAEALEHAHQNGVVHRDLKPSNIMLVADSPGGSPRPRLMDFGLALREHGEVTVTMDGQIVGTPAYMSPEQARGDGHHVDARSDVYSLGAILYQLLTNEIPFRGTVRMLLDQVLYEEPRPPRKLNDQIPRDLETICLKCLAKDASARYHSARALRDDLLSYLNGAPISARPVNRVARAWRWCRRNPGIATLSLLSVVLLMIVVAVTVASSIRNANSYRRERLARERAERRLYYSQVHQSYLQYRANDLPAARATLGQAVPAPGRRDWRGWEWYYLDRIAHPSQRTYEAGIAGAEWIHSLAFSPDGNYLAAGSGVPNFLDRRSTTPASLKVWNVVTDELVLDLGGKTLSVVSLAFSPDGKRIAAAEQDLYYRPSLQPAVTGSLRIWDLKTGSELTKLEHHAGKYSDLVFSPDGKFLAAQHEHGMRIWNVEGGAETCFLAEMTLWRFAPENEGIEAVGPDRTRAMFDAASGRRIRPLEKVPPGKPSTDGRFTVSTTSDLRTIQLWDVSTQRLHATIPDQGARATEFDPAGGLLAYGHSDGTVRVWDLVANAERFVFRGHTRRVMSLAFSPDGTRLASGDWDGITKVWDLTRNPETMTLGEPAADFPVEALAFSADARHVVAFRARCRDLALWNLSDGTVISRQNLPVSQTRRTPGRTAALSRDGTRLAAIAADTDDTMVQIWEVPGGQQSVVLKGHRLPVGFVAFGSRGRHVITAAWDRAPSPLAQVEFRVWESDTGKALFQQRVKGHRVSRLALDPQGLHLAVAIGTGGIDEPHELTVWDIARQRVVMRTAEHGSILLGLAFSPDGRFLASSSVYDGGVKIWNVATAARTLDFARDTIEIEDLVFSPDGRRLAGLTRRKLTLWDPETGHEVISLECRTGANDYIFGPQVVFSADGKQIAANQFDETIVVWSVGRKRD